jgi:hypothetical protein
MQGAARAPFGLLAIVEEQKIANAHDGLRGGSPSLRSIV